MDSITIIGDVHGCYDTLMHLIEQLPDKENICFVGDLIDRGPSSKSVVSFVKNNHHRCIMGNHEDLLLKNFEEHGIGFEDGSTFQLNGGDEAYRSYGLLEPNPSERELELFFEHIEFVRDLSQYLLFENLKDENGLSLLISHAPILDKFAFGIYDEQYLLWNRIFPNEDGDGKHFNIFGHNVLKNPRIKKSWAAIDTGCFYGDWHAGHEGYLSAIEFPSKRVFSQKCVDRVTWRL